MSEHSRLNDDGLSRLPPTLGVIIDVAVQASLRAAQASRIMALDAPSRSKEEATCPPQRN
jgi:hypothetical protein